METWLTPIGLKVNLDTLNEVCTLADIITKLSGYHKDCYIVGRDDEMSTDKRSHYHIHFWSCKKITKNALKTFRCEKFRAEYDRSMKLYLGQELPDADKLRWLGYAIKENFVEQKGLDDLILQIEEASKVAREFKKCKLVNSQVLAEKDKKKKELKDKLYEYIDGYRTIDPIQEKDFKYDAEYMAYLESHKYICKAIIHYFINNDMSGHLSKTIIERYFKGYQIKKGKDQDYFYHFIFKD